MDTPYHQDMIETLRDSMVESSDEHLAEMGCRTNKFILGMIADLAKQNAFVVGNTLIQFKENGQYIQYRPIHNIGQSITMCYCVDHARYYTQEELDIIPRVTMGNNIADRLLTQVLAKLKCNIPEELRDLTPMTKDATIKTINSVDTEREIARIMTLDLTLKDKVELMAQL
jgi:hypothetical protein